MNRWNGQSPCQFVYVSVSVFASASCTLRCSDICCVGGHIVSCLLLGAIRWMSVAELNTKYGVGTGIVEDICRRKQASGDYKA